MPFDPSTATLAENAFDPETAKPFAEPPVAPQRPLSAEAMLQRDIAALSMPQSQVRPGYLTGVAPPTPAPSFQQDIASLAMPQATVRPAYLTGEPVPGTVSAGVSGATGELVKGAVSPMGAGIVAAHALPPLGLAVDALMVGGMLQQAYKHLANYRETGNREELGRGSALLLATGVPIARKGGGILHKTTRELRDLGQPLPEKGAHPAAPLSEADVEALFLKPATEASERELAAATAKPIDPRIAELKLEGVNEADARALISGSKTPEEVVKANLEMVRPAFIATPGGTGPRGHAEAWVEGYEQAIERVRNIVKPTPEPAAPAAPVSEVAGPTTKGEPSATETRKVETSVQPERERTDAQRVSAETGAGDSLQPAAPVGGNAPAEAAAETKLGDVGARLTENEVDLTALNHPDKSIQRLMGSVSDRNLPVYESIEAAAKAHPEARFHGLDVVQAERAVNGKPIVSRGEQGGPRNVLLSDAEDAVSRQFGRVTVVVDPAKLKPQSGPSRTSLDPRHRYSVAEIEEIPSDAIIGIALRKGDAIKSAPVTEVGGNAPPAPVAKAELGDLTKATVEATVPVKPAELTSISESEAAQIAAGDKIRWEPNEKERRYQGPVEGTVVDVTSNTEGEKGYHVSVPLEGDPGNVVRVWANRGKVVSREPAKVEAQPAEVRKTEDVGEARTTRRAKTVVEIADEIAAKGIEPSASYGQFVKARNLKPEIDAKEWLPIYRQSLELANLKRQAEVAQRAAAVAVETPAKAETTSPPSGPGIVGMGGATPSEFRPSGQTATALKNAAIEADRVRMGLPKFAPVMRQKYGETWDRAMAEIDRDPTIQDKLISELRTKPRALANNVETALLEHRMVDLKNEFAKATRDLAQAVDDNRPEAAAEARERIAYFSDKAYELTEVTKAVGIEWGRTGVGRKQWVDDEFNLVQMVADRRAIRDGQPLTEKEFTDTKVVADRFAKIQDRLGKRITELQDKIARGDYGERAKKEPLRDPEIDRLRYQLERIKREWHEGLLNERLRNRPLFRRIVSGAVEVPNALRAIMTSMDLSAVLRQGKFMVLAHPFRTLRSIKPMLEAFASPARSLAIETEIAERPNYPLYRQSKLYLAEHGSSLSQMEEQWMSRWAEKIPGVGASQRAYNTFLNKVRADSFDAMARTLSNGDRPLTADEARIISNYINASTGRGTLGMRDNAAVALNTAFFAPRYVASRFQMLLGQPMWYGALSGKVPFRGTLKARALVASEYARIMAGLGAVYTLGALAGDKIETDPRSTDFGKIRIGNTRIDPMAGVQQATVLLSRELSGKTKTARGRVVPIRGRVPYGGTTAFDVLTRFGRTKLAPVPGTVVDLLQQKNFAGEPVTLGSEALDLVTPMSIGDIYKSMIEQGVPKGTALGVLSIFGENIQTYDALHPKRANP